MANFAQRLQFSCVSISNESYKLNKLSQTCRIEGPVGSQNDWLLALLSNEIPGLGEKSDVKHAQLGQP